MTSTDDDSTAGEPQLERLQRRYQRTIRVVYPDAAALERSRTTILAEVSTAGNRRPTESGPMSTIPQLASQPFPS